MIYITFAHWICGLEKIQLPFMKKIDKIGMILMQCVTVNPANRLQNPGPIAVQPVLRLVYFAYRLRLQIQGIQGIHLVNRRTAACGLGGSKFDP